MTADVISNSLVDGARSPAPTGLGPHPGKGMRPSLPLGGAQRVPPIRGVRSAHSTLERAKAAGKSLWQQARRAEGGGVRERQARPAGAVAGRFGDAQEVLAQAPPAAG